LDDHTYRRGRSVSRKRAFAPIVAASESSEPTELLLLQGYANIAVDRNGGIFELNPSLIGDRVPGSLPPEAIRQPLIIDGEGKIRGGAYGGMLPNTAVEINQFNDPSKDDASRPAF
jgi:hypothetical protein